MSKTYFPNEHYYEGDTKLCVTVQDDETGEQHPLEFAGGEPRHSPDGFAWGYGGSGPAELARAILFDHLGRMPEAALYQDFKFAMIATLPQDSIDWTLSSETIQGFIDARAKEKLAEAERKV